MFVGHYAAALAARAAEPRAPLWTYVLGCQAIDIAWSGLILAGVERASVDPSLPGSALVLSHMPYTHSLPAAVLWSIAVGAGLMALLKLPRRAGLFIGLAVFSHWLLDFLVHRPDLPLLWDGPKVGLGLWNHAVLEEAVEMGLLAMAAAAWGWRRGLEGRSWKGAVGLLGFLLFLQLVPLLSPLGGEPVAMGGTALAAYLVTCVFAWMAEPYVKKA
ncbi:hypothetical protein [Caulobacter sp. FWC2]|uniref:hypothetical protein n=1 Tax=Caulobacter sp. FWC2 TaxID=69664 RepID=UPI000C14FB51|nr:hypothetical protein [Caulobacter sp. FWC2]PIB93898.1 hypothetical protein CSW62_21385 [Caulobacter sp. FWC2]